MTRRRQVEVLRERVEVARLRRVLAAYDVLDSNKARRQPVREMHDEGSVYDMTKRLKGCNLGRDLERNYSPAKSLVHQLRVNVVGSLGKLRVNTEANGDEAADYFNEDWAKDCDFRDDCDWSTHLQNVLASVVREGDMLSVLDDNLIEGDSGKLMTWEADQIAPLAENALKGTKYAGLKQDNGILRDNYGRVVAYVTTGKRGLTVIEEAKDATVWPRELARMPKNPWRLNQGRGVPSLLTGAANLVDLYEILSSELATAKRASKQYAYVKRTNATTDYDDPASDPAYLPENDGRTATDVATDGANESTRTGAKNYERLEALTGGLTDYIDPLDDVQFPPADRPNVHLAEFLDAINGMAGASLGIARAYTRMRADSSYTAFRGDMIMTWVTFRWLQKWLERSYADWVAIRVLGRAQRKGLIPKLPVGWRRALSWSWPKMPEVDELDYQNSVAAGLKNGTVNYSDLLGPDWERKLRDAGEQIDVLREINYPAKVLETASGGVADNPKKDNAQPAQTKNGDQE